MPYKDKEKARQASKESAARWSKRNPEKANAKGREWRARNPKYMLVHSARRRSKRDGLDFNLTIENCPDIPEICPIALIPLFQRNDGTKGPCMNSPSLDRVDNSLGYVDGNVRVISYLGNKRKADMSIEDVERLLAYMKGEI